MTDAQLRVLLEAAQPTPVMYLTGGKPMFPSPREQSDAAWRQLGEELGFHWETVNPIRGKGQRFFTAVEKGSAE